MGKIEMKQPITAPPRHVFAFFVPQRMPYWYGPEMQSCFEVQDGAADFAVGQKVRISGTLGGRIVSHTAVVTGFAEARLLEWRFQDAHGVRGLERWELEGVWAGSVGLPEHTIVHFFGQYEFPGLLGRLLDRLVTRRAVARRSGGYLRRLAGLVEQRAEPAHSWRVVK
jgi:Polyketide cyclase / dehydrase and lipid transport